MIVPVKVSPVSAGIGIQSTVHRLEASVQPWNMKEQEEVPVECYGLHVLLFQQGDIRILFAVHAVEKVSLVFLDLLIGQAVEYNFVSFFFDAEVDGPSVCIVKR